MGNLTKDQVRDLSTPGRYSDGDGLILKIGPSGGKSWILRVQVNGRRRDIGLGDSRDLSLRAARAAAADLRKLARAGIDPLEERRKEVVVVPTFKEATKKVHAELLKGWKNGKHTDQWLTTVEKYAYPKLGDLRVDQIEGPLVRDVLAEIWLDKPETARRLKQRIGTVLDWCYAKGFRPTEEAGTVLKPQRKGDRVPYSGSRRLEPIISASIAEIIIPFAENMAAYIYQQDGWPHFLWKQDELAEQLAAVSRQQGRLIGRMEALGLKLRAEAVLETLTEEVSKSSDIEGETLDREQVRSSLARRLGMDAAGLKTPDRNVEGVVEMMLDATQNYAAPLTAERLFGWHAALFPTGRSGMNRIVVGAWRTEQSGPMQVVSGPYGREKVHYARGILRKDEAGGRSTSYSLVETPG